MNSITPEIKRQHMTFCLSDLCGDGFSDDTSAFIGTVGSGEWGLYLITWQGVSKANDPSITFKHPEARIEVDRFVDVNITVVERDDDE